MVGNLGDFVLVFVGALDLYLVICLLFLGWGGVGED